MSRIAWLLALALGATPLAGSDLEEIRKRGTLRVIAHKEEAPEMFRFSGSGEPGFEREWLEGFAAFHSVTLEPVKVPSSAERIPTLLSGEGDVIIGMVDTEERRKRIAFTSEVLPIRHLVVTCKPAPAIRTVEGLRRSKFGVVDATSWKREALAAGVPASKMTLFPNRVPVFAALANGRITATVMTNTDFLLEAKAHPCLESGVELGEAGSAAWGIRKQDADLQAALATYIKNYRAGPSWNRLIVKYFGNDALNVLGRK